MKRAILIMMFTLFVAAGALAADASGVEGGNFGKLGIGGRAGYDRFETTPVQWLHRNDDADAKLATMNAAG